MLAELRAQVIHNTARQVIERMIPPIPLEIREWATLESAQKLDQEVGDFKEAACHYFTVYEKSKDPYERARAAIDLSQELINLGSFRQARNFLGPGRWAMNGLADSEIELASQHFARQMESTPQRQGFLAHENLLRGERMLVAGSPKMARQHFEEAVRIRTEVEPYPKGLADAYLGLSATYLKQFDLPAFASYLRLAAQAHSYTVLRSVFGG